MATIKSINLPKRVPDDARDKWERLQDKTQQLEALLEMTYGGAGETFNAMSQSLRDRYLWACADMVRDCAELVESLGPVVYRPEASHG
jgi:hypothetical protein